MKRSSCLSALLVGFSVMTASVAFAAETSAPDAPPATSKANGAKPVRVAQLKTTRGPVAVQDPATGGGTAPTEAAPAPAAEPTPAPAPAATEPSSPAISIGNATTGVAGSDAPGGSAEEPKAAPKFRPWEGTQIYHSLSATTATFIKSQHQSYDPTVESALWLLPRYGLSPAFQLRGRLIVSYEYTNSDSTTRRNDPRLSDTTFQLFYRKIPELPGGIKPMVAINATLPTSPESRAKTLIFSPGLTVQLSKTFEHVLGGSVDVAASGIYSHPIYNSQRPVLQESAPYAFQCVSGTDCQDQASGTRNTSDSIGYTFVLSGTWGKWTPNIFYLGSSGWAYQGSVPTRDGQVVQSAEGFNPTALRQKHYFQFALDYEVTPWLTPEIGYWVDKNAISEDGTRGSIFYDKYQDMRLFLGVNINVDNILKVMEGKPAEPGVVRAQKKRPMFTM